MKRKFLSFVLAFCLILPCTFALTACGETKLEKSDYIEAYAGVEAAYSSYMNAGSSALSLDVEDSDLTTIDREGQMHRMGTACVQFVIFLKNLCENDTFELSDGFQDMVVVDDSHPSNVETFNLRIKMAYDSKTELITSEVYCLTDDGYSTYLVFEIKFDFETKVLDYFTITGAMGSTTLTSDDVNYFMFKNNTFKMLDHSNAKFADYADQILTQCNTIGEATFGENLPDYSDEYLSAMYQGAGLA